MWSRKSAMLGSLAVAMYLLGLTLRNSQLVTIAVVIFVFLTWAALYGGHADVASSGRRAEEWTGEEGVALSNLSAMRKLSGARIFEDSARIFENSSRIFRNSVVFLKIVSIF